MPPTTRRQSNVKATECSEHEPGQVSVVRHQAQSSFLQLPLELQKTIVEYVRSFLIDLDNAFADRL